MTFERDGAVERAVRLADEVSKYQEQLKEHVSSNEDRIAGFKERINDQQKEISDLEESNRTKTKHLEEKRNEVITLQDQVSKAIDIFWTRVQVLFNRLYQSVVRCDCFLDLSQTFCIRLGERVQM